jgi:hypothetical protein
MTHHILAVLSSDAGVCVGLRRRGGLLGVSWQTGTCSIRSASRPLRVPVIRQDWYPPW